jgi:hypothetical protein
MTLHNSTMALCMKCIQPLRLQEMLNGVAVYLC